MDINEQLIELVRRHSCLFDLSKKLYKNKSHKDMLWARIGRRLNLDGETCKKRWKTLRDSHRRAKRTTVVASGSAAPLHRKMWRYFEAMSFLDNVQSSRSTIGNIPQPVSPPPVLVSPTVVSPSYFSPSTNSQLEAMSPLSPATVPPETPETSSASSRRRPSGTLAKKQIQTDFSNFLKGLSETVQNTNGIFNHQKEQTPTEYFFISLAKMLDAANIPPHILHATNQEICNIVFDTIKNLHLSNNR